MTAALPHPPLDEPVRVDSERSSAESWRCAHCGTQCPERSPRQGERRFCCAGCLTVYELLRESNLGQFYRLGTAPGVRVAQPAAASQFEFLNDPSVRDRLLDYSDERLQRVTLHLPAIHCVACIWLLEHLFRLRPGIGASTVNFARRELSIAFDPRQINLGQIAALLASLGYPPDFNLADLDRRKASPVSRRLWLQLGVAGFAFGNTMLFSLAGYFGLDGIHGPAFQRVFAGLSILLAVPVVAFSAADYWRAAWVSLRQRRLSLEVPIAVGIAALMGQSLFETLSGRGEGYFDSLAGLLFFLLCGRVFQRKVFDRLSFERDYRAFFPLAVERLRSDGLTGPAAERVSLEQLRVGDQLRLRNGELIPADARLLRGSVWVDYSFVTGESDPTPRQPGDALYAGGRLASGGADVEIVKPVSQSYLTSLWNQEAFRKDRDDSYHSVTNQYSVRFSWIVLAIALLAAGYWSWADPQRAVPAFVGVLIVACPCALALAAPFALGTAVRTLGRREIFLRNAQVIETMAQTDMIVFDKTGTLTSPRQGGLSFQGDPLTQDEQEALRSLAAQSIHPLARRVADHSLTGALAPVEDYQEAAGLGISGRIHGENWALGSLPWLQRFGARTPGDASAGSTVHVARNGQYRGAFRAINPLRAEVESLIRELAGNYRLALLSGDSAQKKAEFRGFFGDWSALHFDQSPTQKLEFVQQCQREGQVVMMVGDGLNDAGALRQSDVGVAVVERIGAFSPASDVILGGAQIHRLADALRFARQCVATVRAGFALSGAYNVIGLAIAAAGSLSPVICAVLMPLSSVTVMAFAVGAVHWHGRRLDRSGGSAQLAREASA